MSVDKKSVLILALLAAIISLVLPSVFCVWEIFNEPMLRPNGSIDDGAERGAAIFLTILIWPFFFISFLFYLLLATYSFRKKEKIKSAIVKGTLASCFSFSLVVCLFFYSYGAQMMALAFIMCFLLSVFGALPGSVVLLTKAKNA